MKTVCKLISDYMGVLVLLAAVLALLFPEVRGRKEALRVLGNGLPEIVGRKGEAEGGKRGGVFLVVPHVSVQNEAAAGRVAVPRGLDDLIENALLNINKLVGVVLVETGVLHSQLKILLIKAEGRIVTGRDHGQGIREFFLRIIMNQIQLQRGSGALLAARADNIDRQLSR